MSNLDLEIRIRTFLEDRGLKATQEEVKSLSQSLRETTGPAAKAVESTAGVSREIKELSKLGHEAEGVMAGLAQGGFSGLAQAGRSAAGILKTLASGTMGAVLVPAVVGLTAVIVALERQASKTAEEIKKLFDEAGEKSRIKKDIIEQSEKSVSQAFDRESKKLKELTVKYDELTAAVDRAAARRIAISGAKREGEDAKLELDKQRELSKAATPEARAAIEDKYAGRKTLLERERRKQDLDAEDSDNRQRLDIEKRKLASAEASKQAKLEKADGEQKAADAAAAKLAEAKNALAKAEAVPKFAPLRNTRTGLISGEDPREEKRLAAIETARSNVVLAGGAAAASKDAAQKARTEADNAAKELDHSIVELTGKIETLITAIEVNGLKRQNVDTIAKAEVEKITGKNVGSMADLAAVARTAQARGDSAGQDQAVAALRKLSSTSNDLRKAVGEHAERVSSNLSSTAQTLRDQKAKIIRLQQAGPGGGG